MFELRPYQSQAIEKIREKFRAGFRRPVLVSATGSGKTATATHMIRSAIDRGREVLFIAHRREILFQTHQKLIDAGIDNGWIMSGMRPSLMAPVHLASIQTLLRREAPPNVGLIIWDEAQHNTSRTYRKVMDHYAKVPQIGLTATPCRADGNGLGGIFDSMVVAAKTSDLIRDGYLVPARIFAPSAPDLNGVKVRAGDYVESELEEKVDRPKLIGDVVQHWEQHAQGKKTIVFAVTRAHAQHLTEAFDNAGHKTLYVDGETDHHARKSIFSEFAAGRNGVLVNVGIATEGYDNPAIECIVLARPTKSLGLYLQMAGRGMRPSPSKSELTILDHSGASLMHGYPDEDIDWRLDPTIPAGHKTKTREPREAQPWVCGHCFFLNPAGEEYCQSCKQRAMPAAHSPLVGDGQLVEAKRKAPKLKTQDRAKEWTAMVFIASHRGLKIGAAFHMYKQKFGLNPHHSFNYIPHGSVEWNMLAHDFLELCRERARQ